MPVVDAGEVVEEGVHQERVAVAVGVSVVGGKVAG